MYTGLLHLHNLLRWVIIILLLINIIRTFSGNKNMKFSLWLLISSHITLLIGLYQYFTGSMGVKLFSTYGSEVMKDSSLRFWAVEHILGMVIAISLITIGHISLKKQSATKKSGVLFLIALIIILAVVPWPFREAIARPLFPGM
jgi:Flp pilus assembly protein protease CpaA